MHAKRSTVNSDFAKSSVGLVLAVTIALTLIPAALYGMIQTEKQQVGGILDEYRRAVNVLESVYRDVQIEGRSTVDTVAEPFAQAESKPKTSHRAENFGYVFSDGWEKVHYVRSEPEYFDRVLVNAGGHNFAVRRTTAKGPYFLEQSNNAKDGPPLFKLLREDVRDGLYSPGHITDFLEGLSSPEFRVREVTRTVEGDSSLVKISFECPRSGKRKRDLSGWITLDTSMEWTIREYAFEIRQDNMPKVFKAIGSARSKREGGFIVPLFFENKQISNHEPQKLTRTATRRYEISKFLPITTPHEEFTLAAYGLGEFEDPSPRTTNRFSYLAGATGVGALLGSLLLIWAGKMLRQRRTAIDEAGAPG